MDRDTLLQFVRRDWSAVAASKADFWRGFKARRSTAEVLNVVDQMRAHAQRVRPDWPTQQDRLADLLVHHRVGEALRAVAGRSR